MSTGRKKVIVRRFSTGLLSGYLPTSAFVQQRLGSPIVDLLDPAGRVQPVALSEIQTISFVRDFNPGDTVHPERLLRRTFLARPRAEGLWLRISLREGELLEGLAPLDLSLADHFTEDLGVQLIPPDIRGNTQRIYVPRLAMTALQVVAVITTPSRKRPVSTTATTDRQADLFSIPLPTNTRPQ